METWEERKKREKLALKKKEEAYRKEQWKIILEIEKSKQTKTQLPEQSDKT
jgi:hypothetical protein